MLEPREHLSLSPETLREARVVKSPIENLDGYFLIELTILAPRAVDQAHSTAAQFTRQPVRSQLAPKQGSGGGMQFKWSNGPSRLQAGQRRFEPEERLYLGLQLGFSLVDRFEIRRSLEFG